MKSLSLNIGKLVFSFFFALLPLNQSSILASEILLANNNDDLEELKVKRVNKKGNLVIKFCNKLKDYKGYVEVDNKKFDVKDADIIKSRKVVWKDVNLPKLKGDDISVDNLLARYKDEDVTEPLRVIDEGECGLGILPFIIIGAGIAAGAGGSGAGSTSSN